MVEYLKARFGPDVGGGRVGACMLRVAPEQVIGVVWRGQIICSLNFISAYASWLIVGVCKRRCTARTRTLGR